MWMAGLFSFFFTEHVSTQKHWVCWEKLIESFLLMKLAVEKKSMSGVLRWSSVPHRQVKATCLSRVSTYDSRLLVSDAYGRWRPSLFQFVYTPNIVLFDRHSSSSSAFKYWLRPYSGTTIIHDQRAVRELTFNPTIFLRWSWGVSSPDRSKFSPCLVACRGWVCKGWNKIQQPLGRCVRIISLARSLGNKRIVDHAS